MERKELELVLKQNGYLEGGTKEACIKARVYLQSVINPGNQIHSPACPVTADEFMAAVRVLMAAAASEQDRVPETWYCDNDCARTSKLLCPGELCINKESKKCCPFFIDEGDV